MENQMTYSMEKGWNCARMMEYGTSEDKLYANNQYENALSQRNCGIEGMEQRAQEFIQGWTKALMD
jgi:hypothetical protein